ncbi:hypothetical protein BpHYR1_034681 [Brachionus plicatilis]|uniref:Uncharacterized protein n=1 Tax=Brachionus plicatilis TaxID=10195 RepID=A0A3M7SH53_BRAPC|nr:hypothetical protein BpHYR1_034681 [Brachionus plicatilis]
MKLFQHLVFYAVYRCRHIFLLVHRLTVPQLICSKSKSKSTRIVYAIGSILDDTEPSQSNDLSNDD